MVIAAPNPSTDELEKSYLTQAYSSGTTTLTVQNANRFAANDRLLLGTMGHEGSEVVTLSAVNADGQTLTTGATKFPHAIDDVVIQLRFDQVKFYRSTTGSGGAYALLAAVDMDVDNDTLTTYYDDTAGLTTYYYKSALYNSQSTLEAAASAIVSGGGYTRNQVGKLIDDFLDEIGDPDDTQGITSRILVWLNSCSDDLITRTKRPYEFLHTRSVLGTTAGNETIDLPTAMWKFDDFEYIYTPDVNTNVDYMVRRIPYEEFRDRTRDNTVDGSDNLQLITIDSAVNKFRLYPVPLTSQAAAVYLYYWKTFDQITADDDSFETPNSRVYFLYCLEAYYRWKSRTDSSQTALADRYERKYESEVLKLPRSKQIDSGSPKGFKFLPQNHRGNRRY